MDNHNTSSKLSCRNRSSLLAEIDHPLPTSHTQMKIHHLRMVEAGSAKVGRWWVRRPEAQTSNDDWEKILVAVETTFFSVCCGRNIALLRSLQGAWGAVALA
ncbi:hypothetical protein SESBI_06345 [Sesbania bispinosa]|nr:hypothetical protein SESBI_06345 [Sesbania bispinosa]